MNGKETDGETRPSLNLAPCVHTLAFTAIDCHVHVQCEDAAAYTLLTTNYGALQGQPAAPDLRYLVRSNAASRSFSLLREGEELSTGLDDGDLLFLFEKDLTIALQKRRPELYFVHAAVLAYAQKALLLVAPSGRGKSTTTWALLHHGFHYLSDELGPVDVQSLTVHPYPRALCLKDTPPAAYPLPTSTLYTSSTIHIPADLLPGEVARTPLPLAAIFFLQHCLEAAHPTIRTLSKAEAATRLLANALNPLAHPAAGLDSAIAITSRSACFELCTAALPATCVRVKETVAALISPRP